MIVNINIKALLPVGFLGAVALLVLAGGAASGGDDPLWRRYFTADPGRPDSSGLAVIPRESRERCEAVREILREAGAEETAVEAPDGTIDCPGNVVAVLPGSSPDAIIVSAHLDRAGAGEGAVDDFSGVVMLGMLYARFGDRPHRHTLVFAAFDGEETNLAGSRRFIEESPHMPARVVAVVNLECLGVAPPRPWAEGSSEWLEDLFIATAARRGLAVEPASIPGVKADSVSFLLAGWPAITIHGIETEQVGLLGTAWDRRSAVRGDIFDLSFLILAEFIERLDALPPVKNGT